MNALTNRIRALFLSLLTKDCDHCKGLGVVDCIECGGIGTRGWTYGLCYECEGSSYEECTRCEGSGELVFDVGAWLRSLFRGRAKLPEKTYIWDDAKVLMKGHVIKS